MDEQTAWFATSKMFDTKKAIWGQHWSYNFYNDPKRLAFVLSRYKFAAKMAAKNRTVIEFGCSEGIGAPILSENALHYTGVDLDENAIETARNNFNDVKFSWVHDDFMNGRFGTFQTVVALDVIEHIYPEHEAEFFMTIVDNLDAKGIAIIGTPNITSSAYASGASQLGHVNLYTMEKLKRTLDHYFFNVFPFGMNDEIVHTGFSAMSHYIICIACGPRK